MNVKWKLIGKVDKSDIFRHVLDGSGLPDSNNLNERCGANSTCIDTDGSYECGCQEGYEFTGPEKDNETGHIKLGARDSQISFTGSWTGSGKINSYES